MAVRIWVDDKRKAPEGYLHFDTVAETMFMLGNLLAEESHKLKPVPVLLDIDDDAGECAHDNGGYERIIQNLGHPWAEKFFARHPLLVHFHSKNSQTTQYMRTIVEATPWMKEVKKVEWGWEYIKPKEANESN